MSLYPRPRRRPPRCRPSPPPGILDDSTTDLILRGRDGDDAAVESLYRRYLPRLLRWATGRLPGHSRSTLDTGDLVQDTLLKTLSHVSHFEPRHPGAFPAYLRRSMLNLIRDEVRRAACRPEYTELSGQERDPTPSPLDQTLGREVVQRYESALTRLGAEDQALLFLKLDLGLDFAAIAEAMGRPSADAARMATRRAILRLATMMSAAGKTP